MHTVSNLPVTASGQALAWKKHCDVDCRAHVQLHCLPPHASRHAYSHPRPDDGPGHLAVLAVCWIYDAAGAVAVVASATEAGAVHPQRLPES